MSRQSQPFRWYLGLGPTLVHLATLRKISNDLDYRMQRIGTIINRETYSEEWSSDGPVTDGCMALNTSVHYCTFNTFTVVV
jgi:hypothetical protein